jgi:hypothetical protein
VSEGADIAFGLRASARAEWRADIFCNGRWLASSPRRPAFAAELKDALQFLAAVMAQDEPLCSYDDAIAAFVSMTGALILARAVSDEALSNRILKTAAKRVLDCSRRPQK